MSSKKPDPAASRWPHATRLYLVRHGEVDAAWHGRIYGALDVPLSERGRSEAARAARTLAEVELAAVVSSGLART
ncbi:MAG: bifunctional RNase H/acid phosphatase, partial [Planctomycetes bacterium]|nr:bifunctional RNase H/acid phosphatase [Planctomycetota bacterium]